MASQHSTHFDSFDPRGERFASLSQQADYANQELARLNEILDEAVSKLVESFSGLVADLTLYRADPNAQPEIPINARIETALRALQFHDMTSQLVARVRDRLERVHSLCTLPRDEISDVEVKPLHSVVARSTPATFDAEAAHGSVDLF